MEAMRLMDEARARKLGVAQASHPANPMRVAILTISDSVSQGTHKDASGPAVRERCVKLGWEVVSEVILPDEPAAIRDRLNSLADSGAADLILTTGGTGIGPRDSTPEATAEACQKLLPGIAELMRERRSQENFARRAFSRGGGSSRKRFNRQSAGQPARRRRIARRHC